MCTGICMCVEAAAKKDSLLIWNNCICLETIYY
ncbi:hypothetical protein M5D96_007764 [Drosophila gunungcola]|uniref:Uncharacterized protein n=1 Tax=Drosophila gunungcola TaxID=103775 RepID=A0A9Q0BPI9_9MUSC|nr:hypothetical protein M5D96_007764 [Drosophila gunungcola]